MIFGYLKKTSMISFCTNKYAGIGEIVLPTSQLYIIENFYISPS